MTAISSLLNIRMLAKRKLFDFRLIKTIGLSLCFSALSAVVGYMLYRILITFIPMFFATAFVGIVCVGIMFVFYYFFNTSGVRGFVILRRKRKI